MKKVMVFGIFDGSHGDHDAMLKDAKSFGDYLIVVIAQGHILQHLKGVQPSINLSEILDHLRKEDSVDEVVIGDAEKELWEVVNELKPEVLAFGSDQKVLRGVIEKDFTKLEHKPELKNLKSFEENTRHGE